MKSALSGVVREPLFYFVLLAAALFVLAALFGPGSDVIEVSREEIEWRILQVEAEQGKRLTDNERRVVEEEYLDERVLVREAQALGLEADERIDDILVQKMLHVLSGDVIQPGKVDAHGATARHSPVRSRKAPSRRNFPRAPSSASA